MNQAYRLAVLEDNNDLREEILFLLSEQGYQAEGFSTAQSFQQAHGRAAYDLLILDLGLPDQDGIEVARRLVGQQDDVGIIILTARSGLEARVEGLEVGADAYMAKPFEFAELIAQVNSLLRRKSYYQNEKGQEASDLFDKKWQLDLHSGRLISPSSSVLELLPMELLILKLLANNHPQHTSRAELIDGLGEDPRFYDERRLEQKMSRLRKKLRPHSTQNLDPIKAFRGRGYLFAEPLIVIR